jgi:hypothetical protein
MVNVSPEHMAVPLGFALGDDDCVVVDSQKRRALSWTRMDKFTFAVQARVTREPLNTDAFGDLRCDFERMTVGVPVLPTEMFKRRIVFNLIVYGTVDALTIAWLSGV